MSTATIPLIGLALQGGGAHGAFTWGVLDRLLDEVAEERLDIGGISGTSAGAINAAVCAYGLLESPRHAQVMLRRLWEAVGRSSIWPTSPMEQFLPTNRPDRWNVDWQPFAIWLDFSSQVFSPYDNPWYRDALRPILTEILDDLPALNRSRDGAPGLFICATDIERTARKIFEKPNVTIDSLLASACHPLFFRAVEIEGALYWDGGYMGNPALEPLIYTSQDLVMVEVNPLRRHGAPKTAREILDRINEIGFNSSWVLEMRSIDLINRLIAAGRLVHAKYKPVRFHLVRNEEWMGGIGVSSKSNPSQDFLEALFRVGHATADAWLSTNGAALGDHSTFDVEREVSPKTRYDAH